MNPDSPVRSQRSGRRIIDVACAFALVCGLASPVGKAHAAGTRTPWQTLTASQLSAVWWQWALSIPVSESPLFDDTGIRAFTAQPYADLVFLCGTFTVAQVQNGDSLGEVTRSITVRQGTALFFPLLNTELDNTCGKPRLGGNCLDAPKFPNVVGVPELRAAAATQADPATGLYAMLTPTNSGFEPTGQAIALGYARLQSPPFAYSLPPTDNLLQAFGFQVSGTIAPAVADGYYSSVPLRTLAPGHYVLQFGGTTPINDKGNVFTEAITYQITVTR